MLEIGKTYRAVDDPRQLRRPQAHIIADDVEGEFRFRGLTIEPHSTLETPRLFNDRGECRDGSRYNLEIIDGLR